MVDMTTKYAAAAPIEDQTAPLISQALWEHWFSKMGLPSILLSDQGRNVNGSIINRLCETLRIEKRKSSPYHPQGNSTSERTIGTVKSRVRSMLSSRKLSVYDWDLVLQEAMLYINNQANDSTKYSPFMLMFGSNGRTPVENYYQTPLTVPVCPCGRNMMLSDALKNRHDAASAYREQANKGTNTISYQPNERVLVKRNYGEHPKISVKWEDGPYYIERKVGPVNWAVRNAQGKTRVLHHDLIKKSGENIEAAMTPSSRQSTPFEDTPQESGRMTMLIPNGNIIRNANIDRGAFRNNVFSHQAPFQAANVNPPVVTHQPGRLNGHAVTTSGRISAPPARLGIDT
jgi:hypothetical protein